MPLSPNVETLMRELRDEGFNPVAVCDVVRITKKEWQPAIEAYLANNLQALLVPEHEERRAFEVYRGLPEKRAAYGAKIVMESRQQVGRRPEDGTVAELIGRAPTRRPWPTCAGSSGTWCAPRPPHRPWSVASAP